MGTSRTLTVCILFILLVLDAASAVVNGNDSCLVTPSPTNICPKNEEWRCQFPCPPQTCVTLYAAFRCIENQTCVEGCYCKSGLLRSGQKGPCVPRDQCNPLECVNDANAQRGCGDRCGRTCADYNNKTKVCPRIACKKDGCECRDGYVYDANLSICVKPKDCTKPCRPNERYSTCLLSECVPKICDDVGKPLACPAIAADPCPGGCICDYGYVKDKYGNCIDAKTCPSCGGDPNAQSGCGNPCGKTCASRYVNQSDLACPQYCDTNGCDCKKGYLLNADATPPRCVLADNCPKPTPQCGHNEEFYCGPSCPNSVASCANPNPPPCINKKCELKCFCKKGFVRDGNNTCIPADQCPLNCTKPHERYIECLAGQCGPKKCDDLDRSLACPFIIGPCPGGCICEEGYLRDSEGNCIKLEKCPAKPCRANQTWTSPCNAPCPYPRCPRNDQPQAPCVPIQPCYPGCQCKLNYLRNSTGNCILAPECPPVNCTRQNEVWDSCPSACLAESCDDVNNQPKTCNTLIWLCSPRCVCKKGHFRNKDGLCVPVSQCPSVKCTKPNEQYIDCLAGQCKPKTCEELITPAPCPRVKPPCPGGCICLEGYVRNAAGDCIKEENCPKNCTKANEQYTDCVNGQCTPRTCKEVGKLESCPTNMKQPCLGGCICKRGFVKSDNGTCIAISDCPEAGTCTEPNQNWVQCAANCANAYCPKDDQPQPICFLPAGFCFPGCKCKPNYRIDKNNNCIPARDCPAVPCTRPNEEYNSCPGNRITTCAMLGSTPDTSNDPVVCNPACICKKGYYQNANSTCVPESECRTTQCKGPFEKYIDCPAGQCNPKTCEDLVTPPGCPRIIPPCPGGCVCIDGYLRGADGTCIKKEMCPSTQCKKPNERYSNCLLGECVPKTCDDVGYPVACPDIIGPCAGGCTCIEGFVRDPKGNCIDMKKCPSCGGDRNAVSGCGNPCGKTCASLYANNSDLICPQYCEYNGCDCKPGYRLLNADNTDSKKCVPERECPKPPKPQCKGPNEKYIDCPAGQCNPKTCQDLITPPPCPRVRPPCPGGCVCVSGYLKNSEGKCIKKELCPQDSCTANQTYVTCNVNCPDKYCPKDDQPQAACDAPRDCPPGCTCKINYRYDQSGKCILASECPPVNCTGKNMEWNSCASTCRIAEQCEYADSPPAVCNTLPLNCQPRCVCKQGHFKNSSGVCIPAKECPSVCKDPNASWKDCKDACPATCQNTKPNCVNKMCSPGCQCNDGYVLSKPGGKCVKIESCADYAECGTNKTFVACTFKCPQVMCPKSDQTILCKPPRDCPGGCGCKPYYRYNASGDCVKSSDCPPVKCTRPNEQFACQRVYAWERCEDRYNSPPFNPGHPDDCTPKCVCKKGFWRNDANKCVPADQCQTGTTTLKPEPQKCPENEVLKERFLCPPDTCDSLYLDFLCVAEQNKTLVCTCKDGYRRTNATGVCVPQDRCLPPECADDPNAIRGCGNRCKRTCADYNDTSKVCDTRGCKLFGCDCRDGFVYDETKKKCVTPSQCTSVCKDPNASWKDCKNACPGTCQNTKPICASCSICNPGCQCNDGYVLSKKGGICVLIEKCADYAECGTNETFVPCTFRCPQVTCPESDETILCKPPRDCPGGCGCKPYYRYNADGKCIKGSDCPPVECTRPNEVWAPCRSEYDWERCDDRYNTPPIVPGDPEDCNPRCVCKKGFWRNNSGECVMESECPPIA